MGRKKVEIDMAMVQALARKGMPNTDIATYMRVDEKTIRKRCQDALARGRVLRRNERREQQDKLAAEGNAAMLIFLGKNELGQTDRTDITSGDEPLKQFINVDIDRV
jgi:predicted transcriptional regulator